MNTAQAILFDLGALTNLQSLTHKCAVIFDAAGNPQAGFIMVGKNSDEYRAVQREIRIENMQRAANRTKDIDTKTAEGASVVIDAVEANDMRTACAVVTGWFGFSIGGRPAQFDKSQLPELFAKMPTWKDKVLADLEKEGNFMPGVSKG